MLHVFSGSDVVAVRAKAHDAVMRFRAQGSDPRTITATEYAPGMLASLSQSESLFGGTELIVLDTLSEDDAAFEEFLEAAPLLAASPHIVVVIEQKLKAADAKVLKAAAETFFESAAKETERFNAFQLADALLKKDKKSLWVLLQRAYQEGLESEEIIGTLFWQLKALSLARTTKNAAEAGMKDFPYNKARSALKQFDDATLARLTRELVAVYHEGHLGRDIALALEAWVLTV